jgi:hypothetical protein
MRRAELQSFKRKIVVIILTADIAEKSAEFRGVFKGCQAIYSSILTANKALWNSAKPPCPLRLKTNTLFNNRCNFPHFRHPSRQKVQNSLPVEN